MKKFLLLFLLALIFPAFPANAQPADSIDIYLLTVEPGRESYSVYGHTALRIVARGTKSDTVYNWGLFDFETPNFAYRFVKGKLDYLLGGYSYKSFIEGYSSEERSVWSQKINLTAGEKLLLIELLNENLKPENIEYRYNFFYDNCATRVRDIIENSLTGQVTYEAKEADKSFRDLVDEFQDKMPWLDFGSDFLLGLPADKKATLKEQMFLPYYLKENMAGAYITHFGKTEPLLEPAVTVLDMSGADRREAKSWMPAAIVWLVFVFIVLVTFVLGIPVLGKISDWVFLSLFSLLSVILLFCGAVSDHQALHYNMLLIAFNPLLPFIAVLVFMGRKCRKLCTIALVLAVLSLPVALLVGQGIHSVTIPFVLILTVRLFKHCEFGKEVINQQ